MEIIDELAALIQAAHTPDGLSTLERSLESNSALPGPRMNTQIVGVFADYAASTPEPILPILMHWASLSLDAAPINTPREILVSAATLTFGQMALVYPERREAMIAELRRAASDPRWRVREVVAMAMQRLLKQAWSKTLAVLQTWAEYADPLVIRAAAASIAEPPLLSDTARGLDAVTIQSNAAQGFMRFSDRKTDGVLALRKALGFTISVATAAAPDAGFALLEQLARRKDTDIQWIVRENLKKNRLRKWPDRVAAVQSLVQQ